MSPPSCPRGPRCSTNVVRVSLVLLYSWMSCVRAVELNLFYPFGPSHQDQMMKPADDASSDDIRLSEAFFLFNNSYRNVYINTNGHVSFDSEFPSYRLDKALPLGYHLVAPFYSDVDTRAMGWIYYRNTSDQDLIQRAAADIQTYFSGFPNYMPTTLFIVTWDRVGYYDEQDDKTNTFQLVLISDGRDTFSIFHYLDGGISWHQSDGKFTPNYPDIPPQAGFDGGNEGKHYLLPGSGDVWDFVTESNVNVPGVWMFHIGNAIFDNIKPADLNTEKVTMFEPKTSDGCDRADEVCHPNAKCIENKIGFCCECIQPFYGNGYECLQKGTPQTLNSRVFGTLNGITLSDDVLMHTYVVTTDGRTYSAMSKVPASIATPLQTLNSIGGIMGWLFADIITPNAKNGYSFTGGKFNRTARVTFHNMPDGRDREVVIEQLFHGHSSPNKIQLETRLNGELPDIPQGSDVKIDDYMENYTKTKRGQVKSSVQRKYRVNDVARRYTWENTITFDECHDGETVERPITYRLAVGKHYVKYNPRERVVRYAMTSKIGDAGAMDPCTSVGRKCHQNAECVTTGDNYQCVCQSGYYGDGLRCRDLDECRQNICDRNARCQNVPGSFTCECNPGFSGNGRTCTADGKVCAGQMCDPNAECVFSAVQNKHMCTCKTGYRGDGLRCIVMETNCRTADICGDHAQCVFDEILREHVCECMDDFSGDGYSCEAMDPGCSACDRNAECVTDEVTSKQTCLCRAGYTGDGRQCSMIDACSRCDSHAQCVFDDRIDQYRCVCVRGYRGSGENCDQADCRDEPGMCAAEGGLCWMNPATNKGICRCNIGYRGDGFRCDKAGCDVYNDCDTNARCVVRGQAYVCECNEGFIGSGRRCRPDAVSTCDVYNDCDTNARCVPDGSNPPVYSCRCLRGYEGDGKRCRQLAPVACNQVNNCDKNAACVYNPDSLSYKCLCNRGYQGDGTVCRRKDVLDCRSNPQMCDSNAECVKGTDDAFICVCKSGFRGNGASCSYVVSEGNFLIYAQGAKLMKVSANPQPGDVGQQIAYLQGQMAVGIDVDCKDGHIYWTDVAKGTIQRSNMDGENMETVFNGLKSPEGVAIDFIARNLFFTDSELDVVRVAKLDGSAVKTLVDSDMVNPRAIALDISRGTIYWTDWNRNKPQIEKANMDGTERSVLVFDDLRLPNGLAFDSFSQMLCWGDAGNKRIECVRGDGVGRRVVYNNAMYPFDVTILNNVVYWSDWKKRSIPNINQNGGDLNDPLALAVGGHGRLYGITAVMNQCPRVRNSCGLNNGGCSYLCLASPNGGRTCACPDGADPRICQQ